MSVRIEIPENIVIAAEAMAEKSGVSPEDLIVRALHAHFPPVEPELAAEFDAWERASDEDAARHLFEDRQNSG